MKMDFGKTLLAVLAALLVSFAPTPAAAQEWIDATHLFDEEVRWLADNARKETETEFQLRTNGVVQSIDVRPPQVGDLVTFNTLNVNTMKAIKVPAVLKRIGRHCYAFVEKGNRISQAAVDKVVRTFDEKIYPTTTAIFGSEWNPGIDGDPRITLLFLDIQDGFQIRGISKAFTAGYFYAGDEYSRRQNPASNQREMLYLDTYPADPSKDSYMNVVAHEFQHMIHWHHDAKEFTWVNEAFSQLATFLNGFDHPSQIFAFIKNPDNNLCAWANDNMIANYGQVYLFAYYLATHLAANANERNALIRSIVADKAQGIQGISNALKRLGKKYTFSQIFDGFCVANFLNDRQPASGFYGYDKNLAKLKLAPTKKFSGVPFSAQARVKCWSARSFQISLAGSSGAIRVAFAGQKQVARGGSNTFDVAAILTDSRGRVPAQVEWLRVANHKADQVLRSQAGSHDTLHLVVCHRGPVTPQLELSFAKSAPSAEFSFTVTVPRLSGAVVAARPSARVSGRTARSMMEYIAGQGPVSDEMTRVLGDSGVMTSTMSTAPADGTMERVLANEQALFESIREGMEAGDLQPLRDFFAFYAAASDAGKQNLESLRNRLREAIQFETAQNDRADLRAFLD
ncbi:MAG: hypothetical protein GX442_23510 [Candidatus Riflebacteria bacterium]|nr:hypothetical protein [Candidatus Riflebacteria bacterium]